MKMKRLIATALAAAMIFGLVSVGLAASFPDVEEYDFAQEVLRLADLGIIDGYDDGTFKPENLVKRSEFAKMIVCMLGLKNAAELMHGEPVPFSDVDAGHWAAGYINVAEMKGIVGGYPDGTFKPDGNITHAEALKMVLAAMGYAEDGFLVVRWPVTWIIQATELELDKGLEVLANLPISRGEVAKLFDNSLIKKHVYVKEGEFVARDPEVTFMSKLGVKPVKGILDDSPELWDNDGKVRVDGTSHAIKNYEGLLGHKVTVWKKGNTVLAVEDRSTEKALTSKEYNDLKSKPGLNFVNFTTADTVDGVVYYKNEVFAVKDADEIVVIYDGSTPIAARAFTYDLGRVTDTYGYGKRLDVYLEDTTFAGSKLDLYDFDVEYVGVDGFEDLEEDDILHFIYDADNDSALIIVVRDVYEGTLTEITYDGKLKVNGKVFAASDNVRETAAEKIGSTVTLYLDKDGKVFKIEGEDFTEFAEIYGVVQARAARVVNKKVRTFHKLLTVGGEVEYMLNDEEGSVNPNIGDVVQIDVDDGVATYIKIGTTVTGMVKSRDTKAKTITIGSTAHTYNENTLWIEGDSGDYEERPMPYADDEVTLYIEGGVVVVGIVK